MTPILQRRKQRLREAKGTAEKCPFSTGSSHSRAYVRPFHYATLLCLEAVVCVPKSWARSTLPCPTPSLCVLPRLQALSYLWVFTQQFPMPGLVFPCLLTAQRHPTVLAQMSLLSEVKVIILLKQVPIPFIPCPSLSPLHCIS